MKCFSMKCCLLDLWPNRKTHALCFKTYVNWKWYPPLESTQFKIVLVTYLGLHRLQKAYLSELVPKLKTLAWSSIIYAHYPTNSPIALLLVGMPFDRQIPAMWVFALLPAYLLGDYVALYA